MYNYICVCAVYFLFVEMATTREQLEYSPQKASNVRLSKQQEEHLPTLHAFNFSWSDSVKMSAYSFSTLTNILHHSYISKNQYHASDYVSTFEAVLHLRRNRCTSEFSQYLSHPWACHKHRGCTASPGLQDMLPAIESG